MHRYLVTRRTMTGSYEDCGSAVEAENAEAAQEMVGDGAGVYRVICLGDGSYVVVEHVVVEFSRKTVDVPPPLEETDVAKADAREQLRRAWLRPHGERPTVIDPPLAPAPTA